MKSTLYSTAWRLRRGRRQGGVFTIMALPLLIVIIGLCALVIDLGAIYNRKVELHGIAKAAALAAARELNGTPAGIGLARTSARETAANFSYYYNQAIPWDDAALSFGATPDRSGDWSPAGSADNAATLFFAKVDTSMLDGQIGSVAMFFLSIFSANNRIFTLSDSAIAGRVSVDIAPIAICAMAPLATAQRVNAGLSTPELVEFGFRRGVSYDLMNLNPDGTNPVRFLVNPAVAPESGSNPVLDPSIIGPFACSGTMWMSSVTNKRMSVSSLPQTSPLGSIYDYLNSRFDDYNAGLCSPNGAPPDFNIRKYAYNVPNGAPWMLPATGEAAAKSTITRNRLETIADLPDPPQGTTAQHYGPLWAHAKAAKYAASEPGAGYSSFSPSDWASLYKSGPAATGYGASSAPPYTAISGANYSPPRTDNLDLSTAHRRVLNVPLLACPVTAGQNVEATAIGIGRFFMMVPATSNTLVAEFAGLASLQSLKPQVELFP